MTHAVAKLASQLPAIESDDMLLLSANNVVLAVQKANIDHTKSSFFIGVVQI